MRTTLKRGIGQAGGHNGNGHSAAPPLFGPIVRYRQPGPPRRSVIGQILRGFGWLVLAAAVMGSGAAGGLYLYTHESLAVITKQNKVTKAASKYVSPIASPHDPAIALIAGYDVRGSFKGANPYAGSNSDTLMLMRADPQHNTLSLLSFPRDLYVPIYCHGGVPTTTDRINSAWSLCSSNGPAATLDTITHLTGLKINYLITLDFHAFKQLVNQLHGVYMNVDRRYFIPPHTGTSAINLQPGYQKLDGGQALSYVRYRHTDSDIYRTGRQQLFIEALKSRLKTSLSLTSLPFEIPKLFRVLKDNIKVVKAGGAPVGLSELESYLGLMYHLPAGHLFRNQIPLADFHYFTTPAGAEVESASSTAIAGAVRSFLHPDVRQSQVVNHQFGGQPKKSHRKKTPKLPKSQVSTLVLNAGRIPGEAANTSYLLRVRGYTTKSLPPNDQANAPKVQRDTIVYYDPVRPHAQQAAQQLSPLFGSHTRVEQMTPVISDYAARAGNPLTVVAVGTSFGGQLVVHRPPKVQPKKPPQLSNGAAMTAPGLRHVAGRAHFPLMVPHKIAQYAQLSSDEGVRSFKPLRNQHEVVLTFVNGIEYWQIEESTWSTAPILQNPSFTLYHHGRKFLVYTTGGAIQMVALRTAQATYWVSNTILNQLSNSTMIAIAESLRPLRR
jgi:LCP family protein required for cell wall assembly